MGNNIQFFFTNLFENSTITASSGSDYTDYLLDYNKYTYWVSEGTDDTTTEILTFDLGVEVDITDIFILGNNIKSGNIKYWNGSSYTTLSSWSSTTDNIRVTSSQTTSRIQINATTTEVANAEKRIAQVIVTYEDYELAVNPSIRNFKILRSRNTELPNGGLIHTVDGDPVHNYELSFGNIGSDGTEDDFDYILQLMNTHESRLVLLCGDTEQPSSNPREPFTFGDIKKMAIVDEETEYSMTSVVYTAGQSITINFRELGT